MRLLGVTMAYNEADCIGNAIRCLLNAGHERVIVFDHGSTDGTRKVVRRFGDPVELRQISRRVPFPSVFPLISNHIKAERGFDWVTWIAADELLRESVDHDLSLESFTAMAERADVVRPLPREFWITKADDPKEKDYRARIRHYRYRRKIVAPRSWRWALTGHMPYGLHRADKAWAHAPRVSVHEWVLDHYPIRSVAQGKRKIALRPYQPLYRPFARGKISLYRDPAGLEIA